MFVWTAVVVVRFLKLARTFSRRITVPNYKRVFLLFLFVLFVSLAYRGFSLDTSETTICLHDSSLCDRI